MASFDRHDSHRIDRELERRRVTLYHSLSLLDEDLEVLAALGYEIHRIDCADWTSERVALEDLGRSIGFKDCLGRTGGDDCICDMEVPVEGGAVVVLLGYDRLAREALPAAQDILEVLARNARHFALLGRRLITLVQTGDPKVRFDAAGTTVEWNPRERG